MPVLKQTLQGSDGEQIIYIEVDTPQAPNPYTEGDILRWQGSQVVDAARDIFGSGMDLISTCAEQVFRAVQKVDQVLRPTDFEVQLSIKLDSEVGAILAKASAEAQLQVTMKWSKKE